MKISVTPLILAMLSIPLLFSACDKNPVEEYGTKTVDAYKASRKFGDATSIDNLRNAIQGFRAANGRYPESLKELGEFAGMELSEERYDYDPKTGSITLKE